MSVHRRTFIKASAAGVGGLAVASALPADLMPQAHAGPPPTRSFSAAIEDYAAYDGQTRCVQTEQPGVAAFRNLLLNHYSGTRNLGILRACHIGGTSEHKEGRAFDFGVYASRPNEAAVAQEVINWLLATDKYGNRHALARRLGLMYMIWNRKMWRAYRDPHTWTTYTGANPHTDHIHFSFSWDGAQRKTSFFTGSAGSAAGPLQWSNWAHMSGAVSTGPSAASWGPGRTDLFAVDGNGQLLHKFMRAGVGWSNWGSLGSPSGLRLTSEPSVVARMPGVLNVFVRASDNSLWTRGWVDNGKGWGHWYSLGGYLKSAPGATSYKANNLIIFVRGGNDAVWYRDWNDGRWGRWRSIGGIVSSAPSAASWQHGRLDIFARGRVGGLFHRPYVEGQGWHGWNALGGAIAQGGRPQVIAPAPRVLHTFVLGSNGNLYRKSWQERWSGWESLGRPGTYMDPGIGASTMSPSQVEVFVRGADNRIHHIWT